MAYDFREACNRLKEKAELIARRYHKAIEQRDRAREQIEELQQKLDDCNNEIRILKARIEELTVVTTAFPTRQSRDESKKYLTELVREIDQCIKDLTN